MDKVLIDLPLKKFAECLVSEMAENFLALLLEVMNIVFVVDPDFRRNIQGFEARYLFRSTDGEITVGVTFAKGRMKVVQKAVANPNITVTFKDGKALMGFVLTPKPDILGSMLRQEVSLDGNLNYLMKFAYMAKRLQLMATHAL